MRVTKYLLILVLFIFPAVLNGAEGGGFTFKNDTGGIWLFEDGNPVYYYRTLPKTSAGQYVCNNYLHPVFTPGGDTLTEEFPVDHPYHRGVFWAWHQVFCGEQRVGDGWVMEHLAQEVVHTAPSVTHRVARLSLEVLWKSSVWQNGQPFLSESTSVWVYPAKDGVRFIDFEIRLRALEPGVSIGGSEDEKGYGGFSTRVRLPGDLTFTALNGNVIPQLLQVEAGKWMDFSGTFGKQGKSGMAVLCHPLNPLYPSPWILRKETSMQNAVYPGTQPVIINTTEPVVLRYRLAIHDGEPDVKKIQMWQEAYDRMPLPR